MKQLKALWQRFVAWAVQPCPHEEEITSEWIIVGPTRIDIERMKQALSGDSITIPSGLTLGEMREFVLRSAE